MLVVGLASTPVFAQGTINSHTFSFSDTLETVQVEDALGPKSELAQHRYLLRASYDFVNESLIGIDPTRTVQEFTVIKKLHTIGVGAGWMITKRILVGFEVPVHYVRFDEQYLTLYGLSNDSNAWKLGDINAHVKWRLTSDDSPVNLAVMPYVSLPTGSDTYFVSDDSYGYGGKILLDAEVLPFLNLYGNAGYTVAKHAEYLNIDRTKRIELAAGAYGKIIGDKVGVNAEVVNSITWPGFEDDQNPVAIRLGGRIRTGVIRWFFGGAFEGLRQARSNDLSLYAGIKMPFGSLDKKQGEPREPKEIPVLPPTPEEIPVAKKIEILTQNLSVQREVNFDTDKDTILPESYPELDSAADIIIQYVQYIEKIEIEGHTDSRASEAHNLSLSQRRAESVKKYLVGKGVPAEKLVPIGYGESRLKVKEIDEASLRINRRVEFKVKQTIEIPKRADAVQSETQKK